MTLLLYICTCAAIKSLNRVSADDNATARPLSILHMFAMIGDGEYVYVYSIREPPSLPPLTHLNINFRRFLHLDSLPLPTYVSYQSRATY